MEIKEILKNLEDYTASDIVDFLCQNNFSYENFSDAIKNNGGWDSAEKRRNVQALLKQKADEAYNNALAANNVEAFRKYITMYPNGNHVKEAEIKIQQIQNIENAEKRKREERELMLRQIKEDINEYTIDEIKNKLSKEDLYELCNELGIDANTINGFEEPPLNFGHIPQNENDVPVGYTDIFFWGIPSSGKTCALSAILSTINKEYSMDAPDIEIKFGATYRDSLTNIFNKNIGYLPGRTVVDRTQYMPFLFYKRGNNKGRKISFFELSGEVFKYFYEVAYGYHIIKDYNRNEIEKSFNLLKLLLKSNNQKIHFFFIDYNQETKHTIDENNLTQGNYLAAATVYFRDNNEIFKKRTDAVYVIVTKSDEIKGADRKESAKAFLDENFGAFMDVLKNQCKKHSVDFRVKLFSIGDVYFKRICKIDRSYSTDIINDLWERIKPVSESRIGKFFRS